VALFLDERLELALHRLEGVVDYFGQRLVHFVRRRFLIRDQFVAGRDGDIDPDAEWIPGMLRMVGMLNHHVAPADVIAKAIEARGFAANEFVDLVRFLDPPVRDSNG
jgi:hypothetical protein